MNLMLGTYTPKLDEKGRIILPAKFRELLAPGLVLTRGQERCLYIMTNAEFERMYQRIQDSQSPHKRAYIRLLTADALAEQPDKQGRLVIPQLLRNWAELEREVIVIGAGTRLEMWNPSAWEAYQQQNLDEYAKMSEGIL
jgi:MraZ protein